MGAEVIRAVAAAVAAIPRVAGAEVVRRGAAEHHMLLPRHIPLLVLRWAAVGVVAVRRVAVELHLRLRPGRRFTLRLAEEQLMFRQEVDTLRRSVARRRSLIQISPPELRRVAAGHTSPHIRRRAFTRARRSVRDRRGARRREPSIWVAGTGSAADRPVRSCIPG